MDLSIIIVNYNTKELLKETIKSVIDTASDMDFEIIVVDNASSDGSVEMLKNDFPDVSLIENEDNVGFAKANNVAIKKSCGKYVLLLNSDTVVLDDCLLKCFNYMEVHTDIGVLGCRVRLSDGKLDHACKRGFPTPKASFYYMLKLDKMFPNNKKFCGYTLNYLPEDQTNEVDSLTGAFMMVRRDAIHKVGLLDEDFFMYGEDIDWCYRIKESGYKVVYYPEAQIIHYKGCSSKKKRFKTLYEFYRAMILFYNKYYRNTYNIFVTVLVYVGIYTKFILTFLINLFKRG